MPLCEMDTEKSKFEDVMLQSFLLSSVAKKMEKKGYEVDEYKEKADSTLSEKLFKLFAVSWS